MGAMKELYTQAAILLKEGKRKQAVALFADLGFDDPEGQVEGVKRILSDQSRPSETDPKKRALS